VRFGSRVLVLRGCFERRDGALRQPLIPERPPARQLLPRRRLRGRRRNGYRDSRYDSHSSLHRFNPGACSATKLRNHFICFRAFVVSWLIHTFQKSNRIFQ
jgi:hypothetical protein